MEENDLYKLKWAMGFIEKHPVLYRLWLWGTRPFFCKLGFHSFSWHERGSSPCSGIMDFYCSRCQKHIKSIPLDDIPPEHIYPTPEDLGKLFDGNLFD